VVELKARDIMTTDVVTVSGDASVKEIAKLFSDQKIGGAPVVDANGKIIGMVTDGDLIMQDVKIHFPHYISLLDGFIVLGSTRKFEEQLRKAVGAKVRDVMTQEVISVEEDTSIEDVATLMIERSVSRLPVIKEEKLVGLVSRGDIVRALSKS